jgi:hypothetical protein
MDSVVAASALATVAVAGAAVGDGTVGKTGVAVPLSVASVVASGVACWRHATNNIATANR